ncbi:MAG TPA: hypothetical protein VH373_09690 [Jatrophihabitantaceae bacterium]
MIETFVAVGDSFTEGLDDFRPDGSVRGWADRVAELIAAGQGPVTTPTWPCGASCSGRSRGPVPGDAGPPILI